MKNKKIIYFIIIFVILAFVFIQYGVDSKSSVYYSDEDIEDALLEYLDKKYSDKEFEIDEFLETKQAKTQGASCDGSVFIESKPIDGKYFHYYTVESDDPELVFTAVGLEERGELSFTDTFDYCRDLYEYIPEKIEKETDSKIESMEFEKGHFNIYMDSDLDDVLDEDYVEVLKDCSTFWKEKSQSTKTSFTYRDENGNLTYGRSTISVYFIYKDNKTVTFTYGVDKICVKDNNEENPVWRNIDV